MIISNRSSTTLYYVRATEGDGEFDLDAVIDISIPTTDHVNGSVIVEEIIKNEKAINRGSTEAIVKFVYNMFKGYLRKGSYVRVYSDAHNGQYRGFYTDSRGNIRQRNGRNNRRVQYRNGNPEKARSSFAECSKFG